MADHALPDDERLGRLIHEAYEFLPGPEMSRLSRLEARLQQAAAGPRLRPRPVRAPWWVALLLAAGAAAAAWWAGGALFHRHGAAPVRRPPPPVREAPRDRTGGTSAAPAPHQQKDDSPVIYRREGF